VSFLSAPLLVVPAVRVALLAVPAVPVLLAVPVFVYWFV
jgi:hypothetical protein